MPSIQSKAINVLLYLLRMKRTVNRLRQRVESGDRTYTEPSQRLYRKHHITKRELNGHLVWTIAPKQNASGKHVIYLHGGAYVNSFASQHWSFMLETGGGFYFYTPPPPPTPPPPTATDY